MFLFILDVGFKVGKESSVKYIVIQLHYRTPIDCKLLLIYFYVVFTYLLFYLF